MTWTAPTAADNCAVNTFTSDAAPGDTFPVGTTTVTYTAEDIYGNTTTAAFNITVTDDEAPVFAGGASGGNDEDYALAPISDSGSGTIQEGWSGGAQTYFQNDATDDETVTDAEANSGSNSWFYTDAYNNPGQGSPFTPDLGYAQADLANQTYTVELYFKAESLTGDGAVHRIYNGSEAGAVSYTHLTLPTNREV